MVLHVLTHQQLSTLVCVFTLDRIGRRWTLYWGSVVQAITMFLAGGMSRLAINASDVGNAEKASQYGAAAATMIFIFTAAFGATWLTVPWLYPAEIFPLAVRARGNAWGVVGWSIGNGWLVCSICTFLFHDFTNNIELIFFFSRPDACLPYYVRLHRGKDLLHLRRLQYHNHPHGLGVVSREQPAHAGRYGSAFRG